RPVKDHRFVAVFRGEGLRDYVSDSDPQLVGQKPLAVCPLSPDASLLADAANQFLEKARQILRPYNPANMILLRGFSARPSFLSMQEIYQLHPAAIASYPMYRGLAKVVGMDVLPTGVTLQDQIKTL